MNRSLVIFSIVLMVGQLVWLYLLFSADLELAGIVVSLLTIGIWGVCGLSLGVWLAGFKQRLFNLLAVIGVEVFMEWLFFRGLFPFFRFGEIMKYFYSAMIIGFAIGCLIHFPLKALTRDSKKV